jgi:serine/threonine protein kinase/ankyrin repeat protein
VDKVVSKATGKVYARKRIRRKATFGHDSQAQKIYENELHALKTIGDNDHLIKVRGTYTDKKYLVMLLEPVADGNLKQFMNSATEFSPERQRQFRSYFGCLAQTIAFLHTLEVLHKDIKPENVLLKDWHLILTDFGTAFDWSKTGQSMTRSNAADVRTPRYQSPEVFSAGEFHRASDIWSLGVVFLEMVTILRGKSLVDMNDFLQCHGSHLTAIHFNLEAALKWFEELQAVERGPLTDNEPLTWIKGMLSLCQFDRPSAADLCDNITSFQNGQFCGQCCLEEDTESESDLDLSSHTDPSLALKGTPRSDFGAHAATNEYIHHRMSLQPLPGSFPTDVDDQEQNQEFASNGARWGSLANPDVLITSAAAQESQLSKAFELESKIDPKQQRLHKPNVPRTPSSPSSSKQLPIHSTGLPVAHDKPVPSRQIVPAKAKPFSERDTFKRWLMAIPDKFSFGSANGRLRTTSTVDSLQARLPTVEALRINHFLSSLPEEADGYEDALGNHDTINEPTPRNSPSLEPAGPKIRHSRSQEIFTNSSQMLQAETEDTQFAGVTKSRLIHYASAGDLYTVQMTSHGSLSEVVEDLKDFGRSISALAPAPSEEPVSAPGAAWPKTALTTTGISSPSTGQEQCTPTSLLTSNSGAPPYSAASVAQPQSVNPLPAAQNDWGPPGATSGLPSSSLTDQLWRASGQSFPLPDLSPFPRMDTFNLPNVLTPPRLSEFITQSQKRKPQWESATVIMQRILENKASVAPTSLMSDNTQALVSGSRPVLQWNDAMYGYLPYFVAKGKVQAVRRLLNAGCNPGTKEKPRWAPIYNAVRGASDQHTKCLSALLTHGANVNTTRAYNGRTPLHYAVESVPWPGYSTVIYVLLANKANPNICDKSQNVPLLMLLAGDGPLPQEKKDALLLLLSPKYDIDIDVRVPGTLDNPLHLAIRRKDPIVVDAILEKIEQLHSLLGRRSELILESNEAGFTPIFLAFTIFSFTGADVEEELHIINLLLKHRVNPNDENATKDDTSLNIPCQLKRQDDCNEATVRVSCESSHSEDV